MFINQFINIINNKRLAFLFIFIVLAILRLLTVFIDVFNGDEANYAGHALVILDGGIPYVDFVEKKPPLVYYFFGLSFQFFGINLKIVHLLTIFWVYLTAIYIFLLLRLAVNDVSGVLGALFYVVFTACLTELDIFATNCEILMNGPLAASVYYLICAEKFSHHKIRYLIIAGITASLGFLFKHQAGINLLVFGIYFLIINLTYFANNHQANPSFSLRLFYDKMKKSVIELSLIVIGFLIPIIVLAGVYQIVGHVDELYEWNILVNFKYISGMPPWSTVLFRGATRIIAFTLVNLLLVVLIVALLRKSKYKALVENFPLLRYIIVFNLLWLILGFIPVSINGRFYGHYFVQLYPPLAILAAIWGGYFIKNISAYSKKIQTLFLLGMIIPALFFQVLTIYRTINQSYEGSKAFHVIVGNEVKKNSIKESKIFVWGNYAHPYYFGERVPAARYIVCEYVVPYWKKYLHHDQQFSQKDLQKIHKENLANLMTDLKKNKPELILDTSTSKHFKNWSPFQLRHFPELNKYISVNYVFLAKVEGIGFYKRKKN